MEELRTYAATEPHGHAAKRLAELLQERGDLEGAIAVYRQPGDSPGHQVHRPVHLAGLLSRHGRGHEALEVLRTLADTLGPEDWIIDMLSTQYADLGRPEDGLAYLDTLKERHGGTEEWEVFRCRLTLMAAQGRHEQALEQALAHPESRNRFPARTTAGLLADAGRIQETLAFLEQHAPEDRAIVARHLMDLGRVKDAIARLQQPVPRPAGPSWTLAADDTPPF
ncbi:hypothetical protein ACFYYN_35570 [Streptomyces sp. NPDC001902]